MSGLRTIVDTAVADAIAEHPKYFTPKGLEHARTVIVRKVMAAMRGEGDKPAGEQTGAAPAAPHGPVLVEPGTRLGLAYGLLRKMAGAVSPPRTGDGRIIVVMEATGDNVQVLADAPPRDQWLFITDRQQMGAWTEFFRETLPGAARRPIAETSTDGLPGIRVPWPWPPRKDGRIYPPDDSEHAA